MTSNPTKLSAELLPCPFCSGSAVTSSRPITRETKGYSVYCRDCGTRSREYPHRDYAVEAWNRRASLNESEEPTEEMMEAGRRQYYEDSNYSVPINARLERIYKAMRAAAPKRSSPPSVPPAADAHAVMVPGEMLESMLRIPTMPFPDPGAHSWEAYARAVHSAYCQLRFKVMDALKQPAVAVSPPAQVGQEWRDAIEAAAKMCDDYADSIERPEGQIVGAYLGREIRRILTHPTDKVDIPATSDGSDSLNRRSMSRAGKDV